MLECSRVTSNEYDAVIISGGALYGILALGAINYSMEQHLLRDVHTYIGVSSGAITSYLLAIGYSPMDILVYMIQNQIIEKLSRFNLYSMMEGNGALSFSVLQEHLEKMTIDKIGYFPTLKNIKDKYNITLVFTTYNITKKEKVYLSYETHPDLMCITALRMTAGFPVIFERFRYGDGYYIDGGISDNFPIEVASRMGLRALCFLLKQNDENSVIKLGDVRDGTFNMIQYLYELIRVPINTILEMKHYPSNCTIINLECYEFDVLNIGMNHITKLDMFSSGYRQAKNQLL